jgi:hypothetical protein
VFDLVKSLTAAAKRLLDGVPVPGFISIEPLEELFSDDDVAK